VGGTGDNFIETVLNDTATISVMTSTAPFTGIFQPYQPLSVFDGVDASGYWILNVYDGASGNTGTLKAWGISIGYQETPSTISDPMAELPAQFKLYQNYPNPFNPITHIKYELPEASKVKIDIFNVLGQRVITLIDSHKKAGSHSVDFIGSQLASGLYFYRIVTKEFSKVHKMILMK